MLGEKDSILGNKYENQNIRAGLVLILRQSRNSARGFETLSDRKLVSAVPSQNNGVERNVDRLPLIDFLNFGRL